MVSAPEYDISGHLLNINAPISGRNNINDIVRIILSIPQATIVLDGIYDNRDMEYLDICILNELD